VAVELEPQLEVALRDRLDHAASLRRATDLLDLDLAGSTARAEAMAIGLIAIA
jgi:hypothetical protein